MPRVVLALALFAPVAAFFTARPLQAPRPAAARRVASLSQLECKYKVAVVGGGPSGACAAEVFAAEKNIETYIIERKFDNAKPCGGAIPLCMVEEFDLPLSIIDRQVSTHSEDPNCNALPSCCVFAPRRTVVRRPPPLQHPRANTSRANSALHTRQRVIPPATPSPHATRQLDGEQTNDVNL